MAAQDPSERFDLVDAAGAPLGVAKARAVVHRDGDWHRAVHVWIVTRAYGAPRVLLQRRSAQKDTHPGLVDVSVGGHLRAGESVDDALRESDEELGVPLRPGDVDALGRAWVEHRAPGIWDREVLDVFVAEVDLPLDALRPSADEVSEVFAMDPWEAWGLWAGRVANAPAIGLAPYERDARGRSVRRDELVRPGDPYRLRALASLLARACGAETEPWELRLDGTADRA